jgi:hypothetical protein
MKAHSHERLDAGLRAAEDQRVDPFALFRKLGHGVAPPLVGPTYRSDGGERQARPLLRWRASAI